MTFIDLARILVRAGNGGDGRVGWRREKYVPMGGPSGGDGGHGGDIVLVADNHLSTLLDLKYWHQFCAPHGQPGGMKQKTGRSGEDLRLRVPVGTMVYLESIAESLQISRDAPAEDHDFTSSLDIAWSEDDDSPTPTPLPSFSYQPGDLLGDLATAGQELLVARGGRGGRGNVHFRSATHQAPDHAENGQPGEGYWLRLELKLLADVGIVGFPNVGKSTLIRQISKARPKVGDYPFTTLIPHLGVVSLSDQRSFVIADVPGLIRGASQGRGMGHQFLRHLERTRVLLHLLSPDPEEGREPLADLDALEQELTHYGSMFEGRPRVVALNKIDTPEGQAFVQETRLRLRERNIPLFPISAHSGQGIPQLLEALWRRIEMTRGSA